MSSSFQTPCSYLEIGQTFPQVKIKYVSETKKLGDRGGMEGRRKTGMNTKYGWHRMDS